MKNEYSFKELKINDFLLKRLDSLNYKVPFPIQRLCIPEILSGNNILGIANTGSGKTLAFILPILNNIDKLYKYPKILILGPTRELIIQINNVFKLLSNNNNLINISLLYGGQDYKIQFKSLKNNPNIIIGTPGRTLDHINKKTLDISNIDTLVLDESDEMLKMGFIKEIKFIINNIKNKYQIILFSATTSSNNIYLDFLNKFVKKYKKISVENKLDLKPKIRQDFCLLNKNYLKENVLVKFLESIKFKLALIFVNTKSLTIYISDYLKKLGYNSGYLNGDMNQNLREKSIYMLKNKKINILVATDIISRGIDIDDIDLIINYDIPDNINLYTHRIGRTGRAGKIGRSITFILNKDKYFIYKLNNKNNNLNKINFPSDIEIQEIRLNKFIDKIKFYFNDLNNIDINKYKNIIKKLLNFVSNDIETLSIILFKIIKDEDKILNMFNKERNK